MFAETQYDLRLNTQQSHWRMGILALLFILLYVPLYPSLVETWLNDSNNSHGLLIPAVSLYLVWLLSPRLKGLEWRTSMAGLVLLVLSLIMYFLSFVGDLAFPARMTMVTTLAGLVLFNYGKHVLHVVVFPIVFLFFMVPVPITLLNLVGFPLQLFVSDMSARLIGLCGIPVYADGNLLQFARYSFEVTSACSGIRSLVSFLAIGTLFAYIERAVWWKSVFLVLSTVPLAIFVNLLRVAGTAILANYFGSGVARGFLHDFSGLVVFGSGILLMVVELWILNKIHFTSRRSERGAVW
ncbi:MAG: exosortase/archaeosortase family protein [Nitrososphaerales archaeon]